MNDCRLEIGRQVKYIFARPSPSAPEPYTPCTLPQRAPLEFETSSSPEVLSLSAQHYLC